MPRWRSGAAPRQPRASRTSPYHCTSCCSAVTLMSTDEWLLMTDVERLIGQNFPGEVIPGFEPSVPPLQPRQAIAEAPRPERSLRPFFFQAEDGIRDVAVTGVQTCALPI